MTEGKRNGVVLKRRVHQAVAEPRKALEKGWFLDPEFCWLFFDGCEDVAMSCSPESIPLAHRAVEIAAANGDPCLIHASEGVLAHAYLSRGDRFWAGRTLEQARDAALGCCNVCRSQHFRRVGDLLAEEKQHAASLEALGRCLEEAGGKLDGDALGRVLLPRSVAHHFAGNRGRAVEDAGRVLELLSLDSPRGYFLDTAGCLAVYIGGGDPSHDARGLELLAAFTERIQGLEWKDARTRVRWVESHLHARLGDVGRAVRQLKGVCSTLLVDGLPREIAAGVVDFCQLKCRPSNLRDDNLRTAVAWIEKCLERRPDLSEDHRRGLRQMVKVLERHPEAAFRELGAFRRSFVAPVPGLLGERIGPE